MADLPEKADIGNAPIQIKRTPDGTLQAVKGSIQLSVDRKELVNIKNTISITATGYDKLNQIAGLSLVMPPRIEVPRYGAQPNPFFVLDDDTGAIQFVMAKMSAVGYSPIGNLCVVDQTLLFDLKAYFKMDAMAKVKYSKSIGRIANKQSLTEEELAHGLFLPILDANFGVWLDGRHPEFMKIMSEAQQRQRFAERIALGILKRNCLRHHPAIATSIVQPQDGVANVTVFGYRHELSEQQMRNIVEGDRKDAETISETIHTDDIATNDMALTTAESGIGETTVDVDDSGLYDPTSRDKLLIRVDEFANMVLDKKEYQSFLREAFSPDCDPRELSDEDLEKFVDRLSEYATALGKI
jgi:hypothetical protein